MRLKRLYLKLRTNVGPNDLSSLVARVGAAGISYHATERPGHRLEIRFRYT